MARDSGRNAASGTTDRHGTGFAEESTPFGVGPAFADGSRRMEHWGARLKIGPGGRVVIPAEIRLALGVAEGDLLLASFEDGELRLTSVAASLARAQALVRHSIPAGGPSVVDELIAERRLENERDSA